MAGGRGQATAIGRKPKKREIPYCADSVRDDVVAFCLQNLKPMLLAGGKQVGAPFFNVRRGAAFEKGDESTKGLARVAEGIVESVPVFAIFAVVIGNDVIEEVGEA